MRQVRTHNAALLSDATPYGVAFGALERQHKALMPEFQAAFQRVAASNGFVLGREVDRFEQEFADYCGVPHCVGVSSGTAALMLLMRAHGIGPGDEVIVPAHTFIASALAVAHVGATPVLADVAEGTGLLDAHSARAMIGPRTSAILAVHLYGQCCDMDALGALAREHGLLLLEDAAQAHGARYGDWRAGSLADGAAFSFYPSKNLGALGDGGAVCTRDEAIASRVRRLRNLGQRGKGEHVELGYNERLDGLQAALLRVKLPHLDGWNSARAQHAEYYRELIPSEADLLEVTPSSPCIYHLFPIRIRNRDEVAAVLKEHGVQTGVHYAPAVYGHEAWEGKLLWHESVVNAERWAAEELSLPMHPDLDQDEIEYVAETLAWAIDAVEG
jgi:dTDP-4-amino-4,6-dideoxygalactose transaminase